MTIIATGTPPDGTEVSVAWAIDNDGAFYNYASADASRMDEMNRLLDLAGVEFFRRGTFASCGDIAAELEALAEKYRKELGIA